MADQQLSLHAQIFVSLVPGSDAVPVDIIANSSAELLHTVSELTGGTAQAPQQQQQPVPTPTPGHVADPTPTPGPAAGPSATPSAQPGPSTPAAAQPTAATPSATPTAEPSSQPSATGAAVTLPEVLTPARELLQRPNGEETLRAILKANGAEAISTADPANYAGIKAAIEQALGA